MGAWSNREYLEICNALSQAGLPTSFNEGDQIARGFADLGFEEFIILPDQKLLSLISGTTSALPVEHKKFFCWVPSVDELAIELARRRVEIIRMSWLDQRDWLVEGQSCSGSSIYEGQGDSLQLALARLLLKIMQSV